MAIPSASVQIGFGGGVGGSFRLGYSTIGGTDVLTHAFNEFFLGPNDDVTADAAEYTISRGRSDVLSKMQAGELELRVSDPQDLDYWNPEAPTSPLAALDPGFEPMRPVRVRLTHGGTTYGRFYGWIRSAVYDPVSGVCTIRAVDLYLWLSRVRPTIAATGATTTGAAIGKILDSFGFTEPAMRSLETGDAISNFSADGTKSCLTLIEELLEAERGVFFVTGSGVATYRDRHYRDRLTAASTTFTNQLLELNPGFDLDQIRNRVTVTKTGGVAQSAGNASSQQDYGIADATAIDTPYLTNDAAAASLAAYLAQILAESRPPIVLTVDNDSATTLTQQLTVDIDAWVAVSETLGGTSGDYHVEALEETFNGVRLASRYTLSKRSATPAFVIGSSTIGSSRVLTV